MKQTHIVLREPYEVYEVSPEAEWKGLAVTDRGLDLQDPARGLLLTVPWWRVEEIRSEGVDFTPAPYTPQEDRH